MSAPVADKALAERLAVLAEAAQSDGRAFWRQAVALAAAYQSGQLITLAEAQDDAVRRDGHKGGRVMQVKLSENFRGEWQADVVLPDGRDFHAVGREPWLALIELGIFWENQPKQSDLGTLFSAIISERTAP